VKAAAAAEAVLAKEAVLMAEALADVALATTLQQQMQTTADNSRQQTTINNRLGAKPCLAVSTKQRWRRGGSGGIRGSVSAKSGSGILAVVAAPEAAAAPAVAAASCRWWQRQKQRHC
jgi:hypothetical protein